MSNTFFHGAKNFLGGIGDRWLRACILNKSANFIV